MSFPPPEVTRRRDGAVVLVGNCMCREGNNPCQLIVRPLADGSLQFVFHGTGKHSLAINASQQSALRWILELRCPPTGP